MKEQDFTMSIRTCFLAGAVLVCGCAGSRARHLPAHGALGPYSAAVVAGEHMFVSGKIGKTGGDFVTEAESALEAVAADLAREGLTLADVVSATVYLTDMQRYAEFNQVYARKVPPPYPARTCIAVVALPAGARVEVQVIARVRR
ncbi:MAG: RidA family protein [Planctomycetota bacterium]